MFVGQNRGLRRGACLVGPREHQARAEHREETLKGRGRHAILRHDIGGGQRDRGAGGIRPTLRVYDPERSCPAREQRQVNSSSLAS